MNKICVSCDEEKDNKSYRNGNSKVCIECETDPTSEKECNTCGERKLLSKFRAGRAKCISCAEPKVSDQLKLCVGCDERKAKNLFRRNQTICKECEEKGDVEYDKLCTYCDETKSSTLFRHNRKNCIDCERSDGRNYRRTNDKAKVWADNNKDRMKELQSNYYEDNKLEIRQKESDRYHTDPHIHMVKLYRGSIVRLINGTSKNNKKLGMNRDQYITWMDFHFSDEMTIDNHGEVWSVDHILPLNMLKTRVFDLKTISDEYDLDSIMLWCNTVPVLCQQNLKKNKYFVDVEYLAQHLRNLKSFIKYYKKDINLTLQEGFYEYKKIVEYYR